MLSEYEQNLSKENDSEAGGCSAPCPAPRRSRRWGRGRKGAGRGRQRSSTREITTIDEDSV